ncbi:putative deoxyribonuclease YcfH [Gimesia panareensis]|uniref:Putative deoxyribonuclease YcfH n=1 Tax=Gimesia panareensis TaxID=2527978 RepID=A0A517Q8D7_9PLAN|nr:Qat anti-phage system TatD family nuclease QatD [Gimesia panareensis]QDT27861.1 putative deoxyribonuclease YcfH [Gimesia panareensis]
MRIDTHCHVDRYADPSIIAADCEADKLFVVAVTNLPSHFELGYEHLINHKFVHLALGFHPLNAAKHQDEVEKFCHLASTAYYIGEVGLDFSLEGQATRDEQIRVFASILEALQGSRKLLTLHSRGAEAVVLEMLTEYGIGPAIFHWYSGGVGTLQFAIESGHYFSVNPAMTRSAKGKYLIDRIPRDRVLTESDGPYVKVGRNPAVPSDVIDVLVHLAELWKQDVADVEAKIEANFSRLENSDGE